MIKLIIGPMFAGKTTELIRLANRHLMAGRSVFGIKYANDNRYSVEKISTHDGGGLAASVISTDLTDMDIPDCDVIIIDEGQFITGILEYSLRAAKKGRIVIIAALSSDYNQNAFPNVMELFPKVDEILFLSSICKCGSDAIFTKLINDSGRTSNVENIGGDDKYVAVCRKCF